MAFLLGGEGGGGGTGSEEGKTEKRGQVRKSFQTGLGN